MSAVPRASPTPFPRVAFAPDFLARLELFSARFIAARGRAEEFGRRFGGVGGHDFIGYRPYHAFDDTRLIDWNVYARTDRALVKITRREMSERVVIELDASASMGAGPPGKLQCGAEVAAAFAALALRERASVRFVVCGGRDGGRTLVVERATRLGDLLRLLASTEAHGVDSATKTSLLARERRIVISDFSTRQPSEFTALNRDVHLVRILAPHELGLGPAGPIEWIDPERGGRLALELDATTRANYARELELELEHWRVTLTPFRRVRHSVHSSANAFEEIVRRSLVQ
ncbi:MAG: DUF58 domain-containing protein [Planctomycetota bacterium]|nr:DUF58 domain-containing protein [Planctomycetota bacterium]